MIKPLLLALMLSVPAHAEEFKFGMGIDGPSSIITTNLGGPISVMFNNTLIDHTSSQMNVPLALKSGDLVIRGMINHNIAGGLDEMVITPPDGYWCDPCSESVDDGDTVEVILYPNMGA